jgi:hypothetical protein
MAAFERVTPYNPEELWRVSPIAPSSG